MTASPNQISDQEKIKELEKALRVAKRDADKKQAALDELTPTIDLSERLFKTTDDVRAWFKDQALKDMAERNLVAENRIRQRTGLSALRYTDEEWEAAVELLVEELLEDRTLNGAPEQGPLLRTLKMWNPKDRSIRQIPYEAQFNNIAGSLADGLIRYERKGFKRIEPMICPAGDCGEEGAVFSSGKDKGKFQFQGYCSQDHYDRTERRAASAVPGVTNRASVTAPNK